jgi:hypothetical protein
VSDNTHLHLVGLNLGPGDHVCGLYHGSEARDELLMAFLRGGLTRGEKCVCILDQDDHAGVIAMLALDVDVESDALTQQLEMLTPLDTYLRSAEFSSDDMLSFWSDTVTAALIGGQFTAARTTGDTTSVLSALDGRTRDFIGYESELNRFVQKHPMAVMCLYDLETLDGGILIDLMKTHPKLILGGLLLENPHSLSPDEFLTSRG